MVSETQNILELEFYAIAKILKSSGLSVHSELEVFYTADNWLKHNSNERSQFAKQLLLAVRLPLLSDDALKHLLETTSSFQENSECVDMLNEILVDKEQFIENKSSNYCTSRYCNQNKFKILIGGGYDHERSKVVSNVNQIDGIDLKTWKVLHPMIKERGCAEAVHLKGEVYVFGCFDDDNSPIMFVEKYSPSSNAWNKVAVMYDGRKFFCACAFMDKIFIIGGFLRYLYGNCVSINSCLQFDTKDNTWKEVAGMSEERRHVACAVFEGNIVVSGGEDDNYRVMNTVDLNTVESYDVVAGKWSSMPNTINRHSHHSLLAIRNKLFVISYNRYICEVLDSVCKKFVAVAVPYDVECRKAISIGNKIVIQ